MSTPTLDRCPVSVGTPTGPGLRQLAYELRRRRPVPAHRPTRAQVRDALIAQFAVELGR